MTDLPELAGRADAAEILGSRHPHNLERDYPELFPAPRRISNGKIPVWPREQVERVKAARAVRRGDDG